jgi:lysozyme
MKTNQAGIDLIKRFEGCRLSVYKDAVGLNTVGWGHRTNLPVGTHISQPEADTTLLADIAEREQELDDLLTVELNPNQYSALISFVYNLGIDALSRSTLLRLVNAEEFQLASQEFSKWCRAGGKVLSGLVARREKEKDLFLS